MPALAKLFLFVFRLPTYMLVPIFFCIGWIVKLAGGPRDIFKGVVNSLLTNSIMFVLTLCGGIFFAEPMMDTLNGLRTGQGEIQKTVDGNSDDLKQILALLQMQSGNTDLGADTKKSLEETISRLLSASGGERKQAADKLRNGDTDGAISALQSLANKQENAIKDAAQTYLDIGIIAFMNETHEALDAYTRVTELTPDNAEGWNRLGHLQHRLGDLDAAKTAYTRVGTIAKKRNDKMAQAIAYGNLGLVEQTRGNLDRAVAYYQKALVLDEELGRKAGMATQYGNLGIVEAMRGNLDGAVAYYRKALVLDKELGRKQGMANDYGNLGVVEKTRGNLDEAVTYYQKALVLNKELGRKAGMATQYGNLGIVEAMRGNLDEAVDYYKKSLAIEKELGRKAGMAIQYANLGVVEEGRGNFDGACGYWRRSYDLFVQVGARPKIEHVAGLMREAGCADAPDDGGD